MTWPTQIEGNIFTLAKQDPEKPPTSLRVVTWSNVFGAGGSVNIEAYHGAERMSTSLCSIHVDGDRTVMDEREHLQSLVDEFTEELSDNWRALIVDARASVSEYYARQAAKYAEDAANAAKGVF